MIDLHCHMLPGIDDGARNLTQALAMAEAAVADGITMTVCTPHIHPGRFDNTVDDIRKACELFRIELGKAEIPLTISYGADIQLVPECLEGLRSGALPTLHGSRYFLFEPPHHVAPPGMDQLVERLLEAGYVPVITHPERLAYIDRYYDQFLAMVDAGAWIQVTGGALTGTFGPRVRKIGERFLRDGAVHLLASDGHNLDNRAPVLRDAMSAAAAWVGSAEAQRMTVERPRAVVDNASPESVSPPVKAISPGTGQKQRFQGWFRRLQQGGNPTD